MLARRIRNLWSDRRGAISPLYAVGILALVGIAGVGFDYGRLVALDSELQDAADQAALAAATQLDGGADAMIRARDAATNTFASAASPFVNETRLANDNAGRPITSLSFRFFDDYQNDAMGTELTSDDDGAQAQVVEVTVNARKVFYALTPLVGAFTSGDVIGRALAGLQSATCNVPPMMFCVPNGPTGLADTTFPTEADVGKGLHLHMNANAADPWAPGNFGFLNMDYTITGNPNHTLGLNTDFQGCSSDVIESETGVRDPQADALNSRFDVYTGSMNNNACNTANGNYCPAQNVRRDYVNIQSRNNVAAADLAGLSCSSTASNNWSTIANLPTLTSPSVQPVSQGFPKDDCFATGGCNVIGDGVWAGDAYMAQHHPGVALADAAPNGTRWEVYNWELGDKATRLGSPEKVGYKATLRPGSTTNPRYNVDLYCSFPQPVIGTGVAASDTQKDRRIMTVAAVDCTGLHGSQPVRILRWVDLFLVQPADITGANKSFFTEIVGPARQANGDSGFQYFGRKKAVLIR